MTSHQTEMPTETAPIPADPARRRSVKYTVATSIATIAHTDATNAAIPTMKLFT